jgi:acetyl-CoA/propionyl-CoA carboxylase biotin carboxyl carrier protein
VAREAGYVGAGTVEFLVEDDGSFYFLEVNARLQVEHPVTEMVTGLDLVRLQIEVAQGERVEPAPEPRGHAIECRINAEDAAHDFLPGPGTVTRFRPPSGPFVRVDAGIVEGKMIPGDYDSLFAKLICWGQDRESARRRTLRALDELEVEGVPTTVPFYKWVLDSLTFREASHDTKWVERALEEGRFRPEPQAARERSAGGIPARVVVELDGRRVPVRMWGDLASPPEPPAAAGHAVQHGGAGGIVSPMQGTILQVMVKEGQDIRAGDVVCILEAMKMENHIAASQDGTVTKVAVSTGDIVDTGQVLVSLE